MKRALALLCVLSCAHAPPRSRVDDPALAGIVAKRGPETGASSGLVVVFRDHELVSALGWGPARYDAQTRFELGSLSKTITAVAILELVDQGKLALDAPIGDTLPALPAPWRAVTIRQLLDHTGGIPDYEAVAGFSIYEKPSAPETILGLVADRPLDFTPGSGFGYSNTGYYLLSLAAERVSGKSFGDVLAETVFGPAGMTRSALEPAAGGDAVGHRGGTVEVAPIGARSSLGGGGIVSSAEDWGRFLRALDGGRLVSARLLAEMRRPTRLPDGSSSPYGFGLFVDHLRGAERHLNTGQTAGFVSQFQAFPTLGTSILVMADDHDGRLGDLILASVLAVNPSLGYASRPVLAEPEPDRLRNLAVLQQAILARPPLDGLAPGIVELATKPAYAPIRDELRPWIESPSGFELVATETLDARRQRRVYRVTARAGVMYFVMTFVDGLLSHLDWQEN